MCETRQAKPGSLISDSRVNGTRVVSLPIVTNASPASEPALPVAGTVSVFVTRTGVSDHTSREIVSLAIKFVDSPQVDVAVANTCPELVGVT